jgi:DNA-binding Lrp family transcriptional regulator
MALGFVLMRIKAGSVENVLKQLKKIAEVKEAHAVMGKIDIIAKIEAGDVDAIAKMVLAKIHKIEGIERTFTHIAVSI